MVFLLSGSFRQEGQGSAGWIQTLVRKELGRLEPEPSCIQTVQLVVFSRIRHELNRSRPITAFHTPAALLEKLQSDSEAACRALLALPNTNQRLRGYQIDCNTAIEKAIDQRKHHMLVAMATGTGKTFTMVNEVYRLMKSGVARRILFRAGAGAKIRQDL